jgi:hypothetical protein
VVRTRRFGKEIEEITMFHQGKMIPIAEWCQRTGLRTGQERPTLGQRRNRLDLQTQTKSLILAS